MCIRDSSNNDATIKAEIHAFWQWCLRTHRHRSLIENRCVQSGNTTFIPDLAAYDDNIADFFTKPLKGKKFHAMRRSIMNEPDRAT